MWNLVNLLRLKNSDFILESKIAEHLVSRQPDNQINQMQRENCILPGK